LRDGYSLTDDEASGLIILNGCSIRDKAEQKLYSRLGTFQALKARQPGLRLGVAGCLAQREGEALLRRFPYLDLVVNGEHLAEIPCLSAADVRPPSARQPVGLFPANVMSIDSPFRACGASWKGATFCAFCVVPHTRGREQAAPDEILRGGGSATAASRDHPLVRR
jgi:tRNA-2-methylthio-N6-dimethylallyladenosine synthase